MQVNVVGRHVNVTPEIMKYATIRAEKLPHYTDRVQQVDVIIGMEGSEYTCEIKVDVAGHQDFIATSQESEINASIDLAHDRAVRQLTDWKEKSQDASR